MTDLDNCPNCGAPTTLVVVTFAGSEWCYTCHHRLDDPWRLSERARGDLLPDGLRRPMADLVAELAARTNWDQNLFRFTRVKAGPWGKEELR